MTLAEAADVRLSGGGLLSGERLGDLLAEHRPLATKLLRLLAEAGHDPEAAAARVLLEHVPPLELDAVLLDIARDVGAAR